MVKTSKTFGFTLTEVMITVAIVGIVAGLSSQLIVQIQRNYTMGQTRIELQREARDALSIILRNLRQAKSSSITIDQASGQPVYSRIQFTKIQGTGFTYYQNGNQLIQLVGSNQKVLSTKLRYLAFAFPRSDDPGIVSVSMTLEKGIYDRQTKSLHMASEKVQVMND